MIAVRLARYLTNRTLNLFVLAVITVIHPIIHGTPLDGGALDAFILNIQVTTTNNIVNGDNT